MYLTIYKYFGKEIKFKHYLLGVSDAGTLLLLKFHFVTHGLNEKVGRHRNKVGKCMCKTCSEDCESVNHFFWNCPHYLKCHALFSEHLKKLEREFERFIRNGNVGKSCFILGKSFGGVIMRSCCA